MKEEKIRNPYRPLGFVKFIEPYSLKEFHRIEEILKQAGYFVRRTERKTLTFWIDHKKYSESL
jgi:hypothetical protein